MPLEYVFSQETSCEKEVVTISVATNSENLGYEAYKAFDGDRQTFWHSMFSQAPYDYSPIPISCWYQCGCVDQHPKQKFSREYDPARPFELRIDLGSVYELNGFRYCPRNDGNKNGLVGEYEFYAFENLEEGDFECDAFGKNGDWSLVGRTPISHGTFTGSDEELNNGQIVEFNDAVKARYLVFRVNSELHGQPYSAIAELELLCNEYVFRSLPSKLGSSARYDLQTVTKGDSLSWLAELLGCSENPKVVKKLADSPYFEDLTQQYNRLIFELKRDDYYSAIASQLPSSQIGILPSDRDPVDVIFRRTFELFLTVHDLDENFHNNRETLGENVLQEFDVLQKCHELSERFKNDQKSNYQVYLILSFLRRSLLFQRAELNFDRLLFVKRNRSDYNHLCDQFYGRSAVAGGGLFTLDNIFGSTVELDCSILSNVLRRLAEPDNGSANDANVLGDISDCLYAPVDKDLLANSVVTNESRLKGKSLNTGAFIAPELSFDGKEIAFAYCECEGSAEHIDTLDLSRGHTQEGRCYHIFRCNVDGSDLRMVTDGTWNDFDPCFLPNGRIAFITERRNGYLRCGRDCPNYTLFDMNPDGSKMRCLSRHETNEWAPSVSNSGQILWTRWDYIDRFGCIAHGAWTTSPNGRNPRAICGNYAPRHERPDSVLDIRAIPGSSKLIATAGPHHGQSFGSIIEIDPNAPDDPYSPITRMTPEIGFPESQDGYQVWGTPWPLAEDLFLAVADYAFSSFSGKEGDRYELGNYGIYLVDDLGNRELIYRDSEIGASTPIPLVAREMPPVVPSLENTEDIVDEPFVRPLSFDAERPQGVASIQNVYTSDRPFPDGTKISAIRVVQVFCMSTPSGYPPYETGIREATSTDSVKLTRRVWGTAPVEEDGSACFYVPANCEIYFQALDENGVVVQSMRSGTALRPNENLSCVGCHESRETAIGDNRETGNNLNDGKQIPLALRREPSVLISEGPGTQPLNYPELVQPILDEHCVSCHNEDTQKSGRMNLDRTPYNAGFFASYSNLVREGYAFNDYVDSLRTIPEKYGARASKLYELIQDHHGVELSDSERRRIALWLDTNTMFFGVYEKEGCEKELRGERAVPTLE